MIINNALLEVVPGTPYVSQSLTSSFKTVPYDLRNMEGFSLQVATSGSISGSFVVQGSCDYGTNWQHSYTAGAQQVNDVYNWTDIAGGSDSVAPAETSPLIGFNLASQYWRWVRLVYTPYLNGSGTLFGVRINSKGTFR